MRETQAEIKAIEAQLRSIRVDANPPQRVPSTRQEPSSTHPRSRNTTTLNPSSQVRQRENSTMPNRRPMEYSSQAKSSQTKRVEGYPLSPKHRLPSHLEATIDRLQEQSTFYVQQFRQLQSQSFQTPEQLFEQSLKILESQVQHINQLSAVQESAVLELKTIAEQVEREWKTLEQSQHDYSHYRDSGEAALDSPPICEYVGTAVPQIEKNQDGIYVLSARSLDLFKAEREATLTAEALRHRANRKNISEPQSAPLSIWQRLTNLLSPASSASSTRSTRSKVRAAAQSELRTPLATATSATATPDQPPHPSRRAAQSRRQRSVLRLKEAVALFLGAVIVRVVLDMVLVSFPGFWTPAIALLVTPAAIAVYRGSHTPQSGLVWGYRLLIIMIGLLLGARL